ncbi:MalY/PatB family protein [Roseitranquillus sediminis]|uniref:MalY/PatB family protein n=1 Tax=Roseitranquillus sediminis TaxID=2809051 RepID=UPI001D0CC119|nr:MalY/PatB family protein [Roseitranquillus sediminis]MBM9593635.1 pyridoxal phosphate-dependent aminotransferase [Roseitranquillus sediminis]
MNVDLTTDFDRIIDRRGTQCQKWDMMEARCGVAGEDALAMWVADMDFRSPPEVREALRQAAEHGVFGYLGDEGPYREAIRWWMETRHAWRLDPDHVFTTHGLVNGVSLCLQALTEPGDGIVLMTPVYHAFSRAIRANAREVVEMPLTIGADGCHAMDIDAWESAMTGRERMLILCSPHNPGGRVWTRDELRQVADFCRRHDLILVSDEVHHDLVFAPHAHVPMPLAAPEVADRLVMLTAASKTFNIAGEHIGNVTIADPTLRARFAARMQASSISANFLGQGMVRAAYSPEGAEWVGELVGYLDGNRRLFDDGLDAIPGVRSMPLQSTYLAWVDFSGTGMTADEVNARVGRVARIAASPGPAFGKGGESWLRFNLGMPRVQIAEAVERLQHAFTDLQ